MSQQSYSRLLGNSPPFVVGLPTVSYHMTPSEPLNDLYRIPSGLRLCTGLSVLPLLTSHHLLELRWWPIHSTASAGWTYSFKERVQTSFYVRPKQKGHHPVACSVKLATEWCPFFYTKTLNVKGFLSMISASKLKSRAMCLQLFNSKCSSTRYSKASLQWSSTRLATSRWEKWRFLLFRPYFFTDYCTLTSVFWQ